MTATAGLESLDSKHMSVHTDSHGITECVQKLTILSSNETTVTVSWLKPKLANDFNITKYQVCACKKSKDLSVVAVDNNNNKRVFKKTFNNVMLWVLAVLYLKTNQCKHGKVTCTFLRICLWNNNNISFWHFKYFLCADPVRVAGDWRCEQYSWNCACCYRRQQHCHH